MRIENENPLFFSNLLIAASWYFLSPEAGTYLEFGGFKEEICVPYCHDASESDPYLHKRISQSSTICLCVDSCFNVCNAEWDELPGSQSSACMYCNRRKQTIHKEMIEVTEVSLQPPFSHSLLQQLLQS